MEKIREKLLEKLNEVYIPAIFSEYGIYIKEERKEELKRLNKKEFIQIFDYQNINGYATKKYIALPLNAIEVFEKLKEHPYYGKDKNHDLIYPNTLINNNSTFSSYINHLILKGTTIEDYYEDLLLHEALHFCGSSGSSALKEGMTELLTRKLAMKKKFITSGSGYPKEEKIALILEELIGEEHLNTIAFMNSDEEILVYLNTNIGPKAMMLYQDISYLMEDEFSSKYYTKMNRFKGIEGLYQKIRNYESINYDKVYEVLNAYKRKKTK